MFHRIQSVNSSFDQQSPLKSPDQLYKSQRARIFEQKPTAQINSERRLASVSILPISNSKVQGKTLVNNSYLQKPAQLNHSEVTEVHVNDLKIESKFESIKIKQHISAAPKQQQNQETQTDPDDRDQIIQMLTLKLAQQQQQQQPVDSLMEFSFHKREQQENTQPIPTYPQQKKQYFEIIQNNNSCILKPSNKEQLVEQYTKQMSNKDYFFSRYE